MKKICFFANSMFKIGGEQRITSLIANELVKNNYDVTIIIKCNEIIDYSLYNLSKKINIIFLKTNYDFRLNNSRFINRFRSINRKTGLFKNNKRLIRHFFCSNKILRQLKKILMNNSFDVVIGVSGDRSFILSYLKDYINGKLVYWNHMNFDTHFMNKNSRYYNEESFIKPLINKFDYIINLNEDDVLKFKKYYNVDSKVIYNSTSFKTKNKSKLNNHRFISCGRLVEQKGFDYLIDIMKLFVLKNKEYKLDIYGNGPLKDKLIKKIKLNNLEDFIRIMPENKDIENIYNKYDLYLNTSIYEGFGLVTLEALECGLPVFGFDIPANKTIIDNKKTGVLVECFNINKYSNELLDFIKKNSFSDYQKNIDKSIKKFDIKNIVKQWIIIIEE